MYIGEIIKQYRVEHKLSQRAFAKKTTLSPSYINTLEKIYNPKTKKPYSVTTDVAIEFANAMNISIEELLLKINENQEFTVNTSFRPIPLSELQLTKIPVLGTVKSGSRKYGYNIVNRKFEINPLEAENIVNLYTYFVSVNGNIKKTYEYFIKHFDGKGQDALSNYLRETAYIGKYKLYRKDIYIDNYIPRIMEDDLFYSVQRLLKTKEKNSIRTSSPSMFSGLTFCNVCKNRMTKKQDNRSKIKLIRYVCDNASRRKVNSLEYKCENHKLIREEYIENYLLNNIKKLAKNHIAKNSIVSIQTSRKDNSSKIKEIEHKIIKLKDLYLEDLIDKKTYKLDYEKLNKKLNELKTENIVTEKKDFSNLQKTINLDIEKIYFSLSDEEKRTFWLNIIDKIYIENGEIKEVTFL